MKYVQNQKFLRAGIILFLIVVTGISFLGITENGFISYDDPGYVIRNANIQKGISPETIFWSLTATIQSNWHPLTWLSHAFDYSLFGLNPAYHHATSLCIHILNAVLLFLLLVELTNATWQSAFVALVFAIHPLHVESVAWVSERKDVLSGFFGILTIRAYVRYSRSQRIVWYIVALVLFALGLMAKPMLVTLPFVLLLLDYWPLQRFTITKERKAQMKRSVIEKILFIVLSIGSSITTYWVQSRGGAMAISDNLPMMARIANSIVAYGKYILKAFVPTDLAIFYPHPGNGYDVTNIVLSGIILALITLVVWKQRTSQPYLITGWLWFMGMLVPVIGLVQVGLQSMADRYMYLPMIGLTFMVAWGVPPLLKKISSRQVVIISGCVLITVLMMYQTRAYVSYWKNSTLLFTHVLEVTTDNHVAQTNLGVEFADSGKNAEAVVYLREAFRLKPNEILVRSNLAKSLLALGHYEEALQHYNWILPRVTPDPRLHLRMADALSFQGKTNEAIEHFKAAIALDSSDTYPQCQLAELYAETGNYPEASGICNRILLQKPTNSDAHRVLGIIAGRQQLFNEALHEFSEAIKLDSANGNAYKDLGLLYDNNNNIENAIAMYKASVRFNPKLWDAHLNLGTALAKQGKLDEAALHWQQAVALHPNAVDARVNLGRLYAMQGRNDEAMQQLKEALRINTSNPLAHFYYANVLLSKGMIQEAEQQYKETLRLAPDFQAAQNALQQIAISHPR